MHSSYQFEAEPRVVKNKSKYNPNSNQAKLEPAQEETKFIQEERQKVKIENMHKQLMNFKKVNKKMTPYDIRPMANPKIVPRLDYFLTDPNNIPAVKETVDCQTDTFLPQKPSPLYVPMKTGIDVYTQVEDGELFDFEAEVAPIVQVITTKTLEQGLLELEEEDEIEGMNQFKIQFDQRKLEEHIKQKKTLEEEQSRLAKKDELVEMFREKEMMRQQGLKVVQVYRICREYSGNMLGNSLKSVLEHGLYPNTFQDALRLDYVDHLVQQTTIHVQKLDALQKDTMSLLHDHNKVQQLYQNRLSADKCHQDKKEWFQNRRVNQKQKNTRMLRIQYTNEQTANNYFKNNLKRLLDGTLKEHEQNHQEKMAKLQEQLDQADITDEEYRTFRQLELANSEEPNTGFVITNPNQLGFGLAHHISYNTSKDQQYLKQKLICFADNNEIIHQYSSGDQNVPSFVKDCYDLKDSQMRFSDDQNIFLEMKSIPEGVKKILMVLECPDFQNLKEKPEIMSNSRFQLNDFEYDYPLNMNYFGQNMKIEELQLAGGEDGPIKQTLLVFSYLLQRNDDNNGQWFVQHLSAHSKSLPSTQVSSFYSSTLIDFMNEDIQNTNQSKSVINHEDPAKFNNDVFDNANSSKCFSLIEVKMDDPIEKIKEQLIDQVKKEDLQLVESCEWGYEIVVRGRILNSSDQFINARKYGDVQFRVTPQPIQEEPLEDSKGNNEDDEDNENQDEEDQD